MIEIRDLTAALVNRAGITQEAAYQAASVSEGNYREANLLLQHAGEDWQEMVRAWLNAAIKTGPAAQVKWVAEAATLGREKQKQLLRYFNHLLELSVRLRVMGESSLQAPGPEADFAARINKIATLGQQQAMIAELDKAVYHIERNANAKILFQALTIRIYHILKDNALTVVH